MGVGVSMMGEDKIWFHGELQTDADLRIYSPDVIDEIEGLLDVALNHNSFPEIPKDAQSRYLEKMKQLFAPKGFFYSVNWEPEGIDQTPVPIACKTSGMTHIYRKQCPIESHVHSNPSIPFYEEIYKV